MLVAYSYPLKNNGRKVNKVSLADGISGGWLGGESAAGDRLSRRLG